MGFQSALGSSPKRPLQTTWEGQGTLDSTASFPELRSRPRLWDGVSGDTCARSGGATALCREVLGCSRSEGPGEEGRRVHAARGPALLASDPRALVRVSGTDGSGGPERLSGLGFQEKLRSGGDDGSARAWSPQVGLPAPPAEQAQAIGSMKSGPRPRPGLDLPCARTVPEAHRPWPHESVGEGRA